MSEQWNTDQIRRHLGAKTIRSVSRTLQRKGIRPVAREAGRSGMNLYNADEIQQHWPQGATWGTSGADLAGSAPDDAGRSGTRNTS